MTVAVDKVPLWRLRADRLLLVHPSPRTHERLYLVCGLSRDNKHERLNPAPPALEAGSGGRDHQ
jgi:hypothetical protein